MASEYHRGDMDISEQVSTFHLFNGLTKWGSLAIVALLFMLVLWFCTPAGGLAGLIGGGVVLVLGILLLREKPDSSH